MFVYINNFWDGFKDKKDPVHIGFFLELFSKVFNQPITVSSNIESSDILLESIFGDKSVILYKKWKYSFLFSGESRFLSNTDLSMYSCILGFKDTHDNYVKCPLFCSYIYCNSYEYKPIQNIPLHTICSVIGNPSGTVRNKFIDKLEKVIPIRNGGKFKNNIGSYIKGLYNSRDILDFYRQHKFVVCMENSMDEYYITEKIINGFASGIVPVYWGSPNVTKYINPKRFLELKGGSDEDIQCIIDKIIHMTDQQYISMLNEPIFLKEPAELLSEIVVDIQACIKLI
jgi:hypothetical protein